MLDSDVFLSHNSKDKPAVRDLAEALRDRGLRVWLDEWELKPGDPCQEALEKIIKTVPCTAVLVGKDGLGPWEIPEMRGALSQYVKRGSRVIPVLLPGCPKAPELPLFLQQLTWSDLHDGLTPEGLDHLVWGITGQKPEPGTTPPRPRPRPAVPVSISRLPTPGPHFVGRDHELRRLNEAWDDPHRHLVSIVAWGGVGKSALVKRWLTDLEKDDWRGAERVYAWSFYSQGTTERLTSADQFIDEALAWLGDPAPSAGSARDRGLRLADRVREQRTLLVSTASSPSSIRPDRRRAG